MLDRATSQIDPRPRAGQAPRPTRGGRVPRPATGGGGGLDATPRSDLDGILQQLGDPGPVGAAAVPPPPFAVPEAEMAAMRRLTAPPGMGPAPTRGPAAEPEPTPIAVAARPVAETKAEKTARKLREAEAEREARRLERERSGAGARVERDFAPPPAPVGRVQLSMFDEAEDLEPATAGVAR